MNNEREKEDTAEKTKSVDLNELSNLSFGTAWAPLKQDKTHKKHSEQHFEKGETKPFKYKNRQKKAHISGSKDKSENKARLTKNDHREEHQKFNRKSSPKNNRHPYRQHSFKPNVEVLFYPEDKLFEPLAKAMRASCKTYQLFDVAKVILDKPERFVVVVKPLATEQQGLDKIYSAVPDNLPFETEQEALRHVLKNYLDQFFNTVTETVEAPKGNFPFIHRCTITQELLGPPNYHRYKQILDEHYTQRLKGVSYNKFLQSLEAVKEPEVIEEWMQKMTQANRYQVKEPREGEETSFDSLEGATRFLMNQRKEQVVKELKWVRFAGTKIQDLLPGNILQSIKSALDQQKDFPLQTANHLRSRLRRKKFNIYKKGPKGISYVCAVKRKFREPNVAFAASVQSLIEFLERNPMIMISQLPDQFLGIQFPHKKIKDEGRQTDQLPHTAPSSENTSTPFETPPDTPLEDKTYVSIPEPTVEALPELTPEETAKINKMGQDLRWLITEGYVTEYEDGKLFLQPCAQSEDKDTTTPSDTNST